jgi:carboxyl-terminal processing protease
MDNSDFKRYTKTFFVILALILVGASFFAGVLYGNENRSGAEKVANVFGVVPPEKYEEVDFNLFWDVWSRLENKYVDKTKLENRQNLIYGAISGLVKSVGDPYTEFLPPKETKQFQEDLGGSFGGIGAEIGIRRGVLTVVAPLKDSPAERVGLKAGDQILRVDETPTAELTLGEAVQIIRGPEDTDVRLTILRDSFDQTREFTITRAIIKIPIITTEAREDGIFVIQLHHFTQTAPFEFRKAVQEFFQTDSKKLVFDLRNNPGGFLTVAVDIASWFLPPGDVVARERFASRGGGIDSGIEETYRSVGYRLLENVPTVVLINGGSASASEIVAGALRDNRAVPLVGTKTFGKGSVQELVNLEKGSSLKVTIARWLTPNEILIEGNGLDPDFVVEIPNDITEADEERDFILEKGIEVLKGL